MRPHHLLSMAALSVALGAAVLAQGVPEVRLPASPAGQAAVQLGGRWEKSPDGASRYRDGKWLVVNYGRPLLRGRSNIFGTGADYGKAVMDGTAIWRAGANDTTRLTTQVPLQVGDKTVPPGVYNVFVELKPGAWTFVLNTQVVQEKYDPNEKVKLYGAYNYDATFDLVRAPMTVREGGASVEQFTIGFADTTETGTTLTMAWDKTTASVPLRLAPAAAK